MKSTSLKVTGPEQTAVAGLVEYLVNHPGFCTRGNSFTVQFFAASNGGKGRGFCDFCQRLDGQASASCLHVRAVKKHVATAARVA